MASLPTETASADYSTANFVSVFAVISTFRTVICSAIQEPEELEAAVQCTSDNTQKLRELALLLLGAASGKRSKGGAAAAEQWSRLCSQLAASTVYMLKTLQVPEAAADSLDAFVEQSPAVRVDVLHWLCEIALMDNPAIKALADRETTKARKPSLARTADLSLVRLQPFAEISKQRYWLFGNKTRRLAGADG
ncbi:hypothetical protein GGF46_000752 [Coemansia sp. RSA 552]|nr:hypothetical protein GGF46_000752 [Coemansia sp. RSA 552]